MSRVPRDTAAGIFHAYVHCVYSAPALYRDDLDRMNALRHLASAAGKPGFDCLAYCLMGTHYHLLVEVEDDVLPRVMHALNLGYARDFNRRYRLKGHLQAAQYGARRIMTAGSLLARFRYVARNPVRAGLCRVPEDWPWSSFAGTAGLAEPSSFVADRRILELVDDRSDLRTLVRDT
jgi:REP element-mobilizing transposase RayT